jgi:hypothetical protein
MRATCLLVGSALAACNAAAPPASPSLPSPSTSAPSASAGAPSPAFDWPAPTGWKSETIPFPLDFAPELAHRGTEEVRFAPHFFDAKADTYFTYSFAWVLSDERPVTPDALAAEMPVYFRGLARAVGEEKHAKYDDGAFGAHVEAVDATHARGTVRAVDAFGDGRALALNLDAEWTTCGARHVLLVSLSPHTPGDATWQVLLDQRRTFRCVGASAP